MTRRAQFCPRCRHLIGSNDIRCLWCGAPRPASRWHVEAWNGEWLVKSIITVNVAIFGLSLLLGRGHGLSSNPLKILAPDQTSLLLLGATGTIPIDLFGRFWTVITANYLHGGVLHIFFNMMALGQIAPWVIHEYGAYRMFVIYTIGGVFGYLVSYLAGIPLTIGASAAICALIGALLYFGRSRGGTYGAAVFREVSGWLVSLALFGLFVPGINNWGHGGGVIGGVIVGMLLGYGDRRRETSIHRLLALICAVTTVALLVWVIFSAFAR